MIHVELRPEQRKAADDLSRHPRRILIVPPGQGKTFTTIYGYELLCQKYGKHKTYALVPKNAVTSWMGDLSKTDIDWAVYGEGVWSGASFVVVPMSRSKELSEYVKSNGVRFGLIVDEFDNVANPNTTLFQYVKFLSQEANYCWGLTATPVANDLRKTFYGFDVVLTKRSPFKSYFKFCEQYINFRARKVRDRTIQEVVSYKNLDKLRSLVDAVSTQFTSQKDIMFYFKTTSLGEVESAAYNDVVERMGRDPAVAGSLMHDLQLAVDGALTGFEVVGPSEKEKLFIEVLGAVKKRNNPFIVLVSYYRVRDRLLPILQDQGFNVRIIDGTCSVEDRLAVMDHLKQGADHCCLMTKAGIRSINLQMCETLIVYDTPFDVKDLVQVTGRISRLGSPFTRNYVILLGVKGTIDEYKLNYVSSSSEILKKVLRGEAVLPKNTKTVSRRDVIQSRRSLLWRKHAGRKPL